MPDNANIRPNSWEIFIAGSAGPWVSTVSKTEPLDIHPITTQLHGTTTIGGLVQGHNCELAFDVQEWTSANIDLFNNTLIGAGAVKSLQPVGAMVPTVSLRLHNPGDGADTTRDIVFPAVYFHGLAVNSDGTRELRTPVRATATRDPATGDLYQVGFSTGP